MIGVPPPSKLGRSMENVNGISAKPAFWTIPCATIDAKCGVFVGVFGTFIAIPAALMMKFMNRDAWRAENKKCRPSFGGRHLLTSQ